MVIDQEDEHLLENKWVLWFRPPTHHTSNAGPAKSWESSQKEEFTASTVEDFWRGFNLLPRITPAHPVNCDYSLFKEGIKPMWEDDFNKPGGRWTYNIERRHGGMNNTPLPSIIEQAWLDVMLCLIGEGFDPHGDHIAGGVCGLRVPRGKANSEMNAKIHIWTKDASAVEINTKIGETLKSVLHAADGQLIYSPHEAGTKGRNNFSQGNLKL